METNYIHTHITPILIYLRSSLQSSLRKLLNLKAIQKMTSLRSGVKINYEIHRHQLIDSN